jgi:thioredoxin reductase (NADPH)
MKYDVIIVGSGPAGLTAALYGARYNMKVLVIGKVPGGTIGEASKVCNFPTYETATGMELVKKMVDQIKNMDVEIKMEEVTGIEKGNGFSVVTNKAKYSCKKIILTTGTQRRKLNLSRESELIGHGVSYCATCDARLYKDKTVAVIGGSDAALTAALLLSEFAKKVSIVYRKDKFFRGEQAWVSEVKKKKNITPIFNSRVVKLLGEGKLSGVELNDGKKLKLNGLFVEIGSVPLDELAKSLKLKFQGIFIAVDKKQKTNVDGVYAAGDITNNPLKQMVTACAEGAVAANSVFRDLKKS